MFLTEMLPRDLKRAVDEKWPLLVPMGSVEFHGNHLPLGTDSFITEAVACGWRSASMWWSRRPCICARPAMPVSGPEQGTTDIGVELFIRWCRELVGNYRRMGFGRILFLVHHQGGNIGRLPEGGGDRRTDVWHISRAGVRLVERPAEKSSLSAGLYRDLSRDAG